MDYNEKLKYIIKFYMKNKKIEKCKNCGIIKHVDISPVEGICKHIFILYIYVIDNKYLIDINFSKWIYDNKEYIEKRIIMDYLLKQHQ